MPCVTRCRAIARTKHLRGAVGAELADVRQQAHEHQDTSVCARASAVQRQRQSPLFASAQAGTWRGSHGMMKQNACIRPACQSRTAPHTCLPVRCVRRAAPSTASACSSSSGRAAVQAPLLRQEPLRVVAPSDRRCRLGASSRSRRSLRLGVGCLSHRDSPNEDPESKSPRARMQTATAVGRVGRGSTSRLAIDRRIARRPSCDCEGL